MSTTATSKTGSRKHRPKASTVFAAAFLAGAAAAVGVNRAFDVHLAQSVPQVESEPIFVALRSLPKGSPVTIYDVALKEWPKAMLPSTALRSDAVFDNVILRHPLQEGQPILSLQLAQATPEPTTQLASSAPAPAEPEKVVRSAPAQPAPAFVPYEAATPIPAPAPVEQPQAAAVATPAAVLAVTEPTVAAPPVTAEPTPAAGLATAEPETVAAAPTTIAATDPEPAEASPAIAEPMAVAAGEPEAVANAAPTEAVVDVTTSSAPTESTPAAQLAEPAAAADTLAVAEPPPAKPAPVEPTTAEPTTAPATAVVEMSMQPTPATTSEPTPAAPVVEPVDVTAEVLAKAAARRAEADQAEQRPVDVAAATAAEAATETIAEKTPVVEPPAASGMPTPAGQEVMRYLVVPERIALQVDHSFTRPQPPTAPNQQPRQPTRSQGVRPLPETSAAASQTRSSQPPAAAGRDPSSSRQPAQQLQAAAGSIPRTQARQSQRLPAEPTASVEQQATAAEDETNQPILRSLFPKLSAGLTAMGQEWREFRDSSRETTPKRGEAQNPGTTSRQQRSAARPQQSR